MTTAKKIFLVLLALIMAAGLLSGCHKTHEQDPNLPSSKTTQNPESKDTPTPPKEPEMPSKTLKVALSSNITKLDPAYQTTILGKQLSGMWFDTLLIWDENNLDFKPWLCKSYEYSEDGLTWTFHLRDGIKFSNGEALDADDVVYTYQRLIDDKLGSPIASQYWVDLVKIEKVDNLTVKLSTEHPIANIRVAISKTYIIPNEEHQRLGDKMFTEQKIPASGPWILDKWIDGQSITVHKNEDYWNKDWFTSYYDNIEFRIIAEESTAITAHVNGDVQAYLATGGITNDLLSLYKGSEDRIMTYNFLGGEYIFMGLSFKEGSPFRDENVRFALEYAIDRQGIVDHILGGGEVPNSEALKVCIGYNPDLEPYVYDPEIAKEYLAKSSYKGEPIEILTNNGFNKSEDITLYISDCLNKVGFNTSVRVVEVAELIAIRKEGNYDCYTMNNQHSSGDLGNDMMLRFYNDAHHSFYSGPEHDKLCDLILAQSRELDPQKRWDLIAQAQANIRKNAAPHTFLAELNVSYAVDYGVFGLETFTDGNSRFTFVTYDPDFRTYKYVDFSNWQ